MVKLLPIVSAFQSFYFFGADRYFLNSAIVKFFKIIAPSNL
ncbi:hypothetical protein DBT_1418 [Dissulfuribacter thermophilus]|uniref:Uncharacterized protein n=1 Tax=Dissulfuribacter thermophilus TaxID=1156395 RepID=A0A1B9F661_9BACT|nr:hypothetical protein DBT_1418 [Dissulfuribacter thermophilus]